MYSGLEWAKSNQNLKLILFVLMFSSVTNWLLKKGRVDSIMLDSTRKIFILYYSLKKYSAYLKFWVESNSNLESKFESTKKRFWVELIEKKISLYFC